MKTIFHNIIHFNVVMHTLVAFHLCI